jgi:hypothetical protein
MPLSAPAPREHVHTRRIACHGYRRADGLWDIEGHMTDARTSDINLRHAARVVKAGEPLHEMRVRITIDDDFTILAVEAASDAAPTPICGDAVAPMQSLVGLKIAAGFTNAVKQRLGGAKGCTHLMELMWPIATTAYQTLSGTRIDKLLAPAEPGRKPVKIDSCWAYGAERDIVQKLWPEHYTGSHSPPAAKR